MYIDLWHAAIKYTVFIKQKIIQISRSVRITHAGSLGVGLGLGGWGCEGGKGVHIT